MPLLEDEVFKKIKAVDIQPVLAIIDELKFIDSGGKCAWVTDPTSKAPEPLLQLVRELRLGGSYKRVFCRKLIAYQGILPHIDDWMETGINMRRFHVPLISHPAIKMRWPNDKVETYLEPGYLYEVRFDRLHEVVNETGAERIHIQVDQINATI